MNSLFWNGSYKPTIQMFLTAYYFELLRPVMRFNYRYSYLLDDIWQDLQLFSFGSLHLPVHSRCEAYTCWQIQKIADGKKQTLHMKHWGLFEGGLDSDICHFYFNSRIIFKNKLHHLWCLMLMNICNKNIHNYRLNVILIAVRIQDASCFINFWILR